MLQLQVNYMVNEKHSFGAFYKYDRHPSSDFNSLFLTDNYENGQYTEHSESRIWQDESFSKHIFNAYYNGKIGKLGIDLNIDGLFDDTKTSGITTEHTSFIDHQHGCRHAALGCPALCPRTGSRGQERKRWFCNTLV